MTEKKEGETQTCKCGTELICVKIVSEWNNKKEEKLQWQNKKDSKAHFKFIGGKPDCFNIISKSFRRGSSVNELKPKSSKNCRVVPYNNGLPGISFFPKILINFLSSKNRNEYVESTVLMLSISARITGCW